MGFLNPQHHPRTGLNCSILGCKARPSNLCFNKPSWWLTGQLYETKLREHLHVPGLCPDPGAHSRVKLGSVLLEGGRASGIVEDSRGDRS